MNTVWIISNYYFKLQLWEIHVQTCKKLEFLLLFHLPKYDNIIRFLRCPRTQNKKKSHRFSTLINNCINLKKSHIMYKIKHKGMLFQEIKLQLVNAPLRNAYSQNYTTNYCNRITPFKIITRANHLSDKVCLIPKHVLL